MCVGELLCASMGAGVGAGVRQNWHRVFQRSGSSGPFFSQKCGHTGLLECILNHFFDSIPGQCDLSQLYQPLCHAMLMKLISIIYLGKGSIRSNCNNQIKALRTISKTIASNYKLTESK